MKASSIAKIGFLVIVLCYRRAVAFAIKSHLELNAANQNANNDTLVFAHLVSETVKKSDLEFNLKEHFLHA